jgi:hypothetical protein
VLVASVIDLSIVPPVYWISVSLILNQAYDRATDELPPDADPSEYVIILPDWNGRVSRALRCQEHRQGRGHRSR